MLLRILLITVILSTAFFALFYLREQRQNRVGRFLFRAIASVLIALAIVYLIVLTQPSITQ